MQGKLLYEYAVVRVVPKVEREEFMNVGVIVYCHAQRYLGMRFLVDHTRMMALCPTLDVLSLERNLCVFEQICMGRKGTGTIALLPVRERFRWLTATRSSILQTSKAHPGFCKDAEEELNRLFALLVG